MDNGLSGAGAVDVIVISVGFLLELWGMGSRGMRRRCARPGVSSEGGVVTPTRAWGGAYILYCFFESVRVNAGAVAIRMYMGAQT